MITRWRTIGGDGKLADAVEQEQEALFAKTGRCSFGSRLIVLQEGEIRGHLDPVQGQGELVNDFPAKSLYLGPVPFHGGVGAWTCIPRREGEALVAILCDCVLKDIISLGTKAGRTK